MSISTAVVHVICAFGHQYEVPTDSAISHLTVKGAETLSYGKCLACLQQRRDDLKGDADMADLLPLDPTEPNGWAVERAQIAKSMTEVRLLYVSPSSDNFRLLD